MSVNESQLGSLITKKELAARLNVPSTKLVDELMQSRKIPFLRLGHRTVRFDWLKVQAALSKLVVSEIQ